MTIDLNGTPHEIAPGTTVGELIRAVTGANRGSAAVVAGEVVPRSEWDTTTITAGQDVEIVTAVQGG
ncbi:sulfur carrier protein ThiS [Jatrophihabitans endophyticus]|uniref:Sulfur carrier protein ThiS n=1 Tax=Jatrophihabitans endophyticus TaxID=1206085 RepID=A0A1M5C755_9ACTN|nr:sulfur carrier protein ThiS [Jatrophihabitans endophyticus]SHF50604.1 sulfur carrier protein ThiS [Jatrophihabitans endophyticus]